MAAFVGLGTATKTNAQGVAPLRTIEQIRSMPPWQRWQRHPLHLEGTLTLLDRKRQRVIIQDDTGAVALNFPMDGINVPNGHRVVIEATDSMPYLDALPEFPLQPSGHEILTALESPSDWGTNYVARIRGYLYPPATGEYHFWISSDDSSQLWLGKDDRPETVRMVAEVTSWTKPREWNYLPGQKSAPIALVGGQRYYFEIVHEQRNGTDHLSVSWNGPGLPQQIVGGQFLSLPDDGMTGTTAATQPHGSVLREYWRERTVTDAGMLSAPRNFEGTLTLRGAVLRDAGPGPMPRPRAIQSSTHWGEADDYTWSEIEGIVDFAAQHGDNVLVELTDGSRHARAVLMNARDISAQHLKGRRLHLQGVAESAYDTKGNRVLGTLWVPEAAPSAILSDWPSAERYPLTTIAELLIKDPAASSGGPVRIRGQVVATAADGLATLADRGAFSAYVSSNGNDWRLVGQPVELDIDDAVEAGLVVTSRSTETLATAVFDHVSGLPELLQGTDMSRPTHSGHFERGSDGKITVTGGGHDVWAKPDQCYFVHGRITGAGTVVARVAKFDATEGWAKCGLMIRAGIDADADFADIVQTVANGCTLQWRNPDGPVMRSSAKDQALVAPQWLKLERRFNTIKVHAAKTDPIAVGEFVEAMGYVATEAGHAMLIDASLRPLPKRDRPRPPLVVPPADWQIAQLRDASGNIDIRQVSKLRGVVTFFGVFRGETYLSIQDESGAVFVLPRNIPTMPNLHPGQIVELQCMPTTDSDSPAILADRIAVMGPGILPVAVQPPLHNVLPRHGDGTWLEISGVARAVSSEGALEIKANGELFTVVVDGVAADELRRFVDAALTVRGVYLHRTEQERVLLVPSMEQISASPPATASAFDAPMRRLAELVPARLRDESAHRIVATATVTYIDRAIGYVEDESGAVRIEFDAEPTPRVGDTIIAAGFPDVAPDGSIMLTHAFFRPAPTARSIVPAQATIGALTNRELAGRLVQLKAVFTGTETVGGDNTLELQAEQRAFRATLSRSDDTLSALPAGSVVEATGVCVFENASPDWVGGTAKTTVLPMRLLLRSAADVIVLQKPRWWVVKRTLLSASVGVLILLVSAVWIHVLRRRVAQRTAELHTTMERLKRETQNAATLAERNRLASEIHDSLEQGFSGLILQLDTTAKLAGCTPEVRSGLALARNMVAFSRNEVRHAVWDLHSPALENGDLRMALRNIVAQIAPETLETNITVDGSVRRLSSALEHHVLRVAQEAITNCVKHAHAHRLDVALTFGHAEFRLRVHDDGRGFVPDRVMTGGVGHFGLRSLRSRAAKIGGVLTVSSTPAQGTTVELSVPTPPPSETI